MQFLSVFPDITRIAKFLRENVDVSKTQGVCHMIYIFFESSSGKV